MTIECITMPQTTTRFTVFFKPSIFFIIMNSFVFITVISSGYNQCCKTIHSPHSGDLNALTHQEEERELTMVNKCTKNYLFFNLRLKTLTRQPLSGNEMIEYGYCKIRPLKILTDSRDTPEQDTSRVEAPFMDVVAILYILQEQLNLHNQNTHLNC